MNPYDFVRIDWNNPSVRHEPVWHYRLAGQDGQKLYSGRLELDAYAETPLFIADPRVTSSDPRKPAHSIQNAYGDYIIPGSSLKGMLRCVVETLGNGCLTLFDGDYERHKTQYKPMLPDSFRRCSNNSRLCIACRIFGTISRQTSGIFLGKVNIVDAVVDKSNIVEYSPIYTGILVEPKPRHRSFYLDEQEIHIAGRKFYFHHSPDQVPITENRLILMGGKPANRYIQPLDRDTKFHFAIDFTNLESDEFAVLLLAVALEKDMRHKIGYGKPLGLGSIYLFPTSLMLVDYAMRYTQQDVEHGKTTFREADLWKLIDENIANFSKSHLSQLTMNDLRRIWQWPPEPDIDYYYPSKRDWFDTPDSRGKRVADTKNVP